MGLKKRTNFGVVTVSIGYDAVATTVALASGEGSKLPASGTDGFYVTWWNSTDYTDPKDDPNVERILVETRTGDTLSDITRGQDNTSGSSKNISGKTYSMVLAWGASEIDEVEEELQCGTFKYAIATGSANAYVVALDPTPASYCGGFTVRVKINHTNTGAATVDVNGLGAKSIFSYTGDELVAGDLQNNSLVTCVYNGTAFYLQNSTLIKTQIQNQSFVHIDDTGAANAYVLTISPASAAYVHGQKFSMHASNTNTGASTVNINGLGAKNIFKGAGVALEAGDIIADGIYEITYDDTQFLITGFTKPKTARINSYMDGNATETTITTVNTEYNIGGTHVTRAGGSGFTESSGSYTYAGPSGRFFKVHLSVSLISAGNGKKFTISIGKNGTSVAGSHITRHIANSSQEGASSCFCIIPLDNGETLQPMVEDNTDDTNCTVQDMNFMIEEMF